MTNDQLREAIRNRRDRRKMQQGEWFDVIGDVVPWAAPVVPAFLTGTAIYNDYPALLSMPQNVILVGAIVVGIVIEMLGVISIEAMFDMHTYNMSAKDTDDKAPFAYAAAAVIFYLAVVIVLVIFLKIWHSLALWSLAPLTFLGFIATWVAVLRRQHVERVSRHEALQESNSVMGKLQQQIQTLTQTLDTLRSELSDAVSGKRSAEAFAEGLRGRLAILEHDLVIAQAKAIAPVTVSTGVSEPASDAKVDDVGSVSPEVRRPEVLKLLTQTKAKSEVNFAEWGRTFGTSDTTIRNDLKWLIQQGYWQNGDTWMALPKASELIGEVVNVN